ncbi:MAG TPA: AAA family ATPase [Acidimicrobiales bacterium]|nr:AAA family ATPase [Acidimicrobiales bacterium]
MRLAIAGKGGVGKTTMSAVLARVLARRGHRVVAIDCDSDPHLAMSIGLGTDAAVAMRPLLDTASRSAASEATAAAPVQLLNRHGVTAPDGVALMLAARIARPGGG